MTIATIQTIDSRTGTFVGVDRRPASCGRRAIERTAPVRSSAPNYVVRRLVVGVCAVVVAWGLVVAFDGFVDGLGGQRASAAEATGSSSSGAPATHVARSGDTIWSIASTHRGDVAHGRYVEALIRLNGGTSILVGQAVRLP